jgi:hypothetical protein
MTEFIYYTGENVVYSLDLLPYYCWNVRADVVS